MRKVEVIVCLLTIFQVTEVSGLGSVGLTIVLAVTHTTVGSSNLRRAVDVVCCELCHLAFLYENGLIDG